MTKVVLHGSPETEIFSPVICSPDGGICFPPTTASERAMLDRGWYLRQKRRRCRPTEVDVRVHREDTGEHALVKILNIRYRQGGSFQFQMQHHCCAITRAEILLDLNAAPEDDTGAATTGHYRFHRGQLPVVDGLSALGYICDRQQWLEQHGQLEEVEDVDPLLTSPAAAPHTFALPIWGDAADDRWKSPLLRWWVTYSPAWEDAECANIDEAQQRDFAVTHNSRVRKAAELAAEKKALLRSEAAAARQHADRLRDSATTWDKEPLLPPLSNITFVPQDTHPGIDTAPTHRYEVYVEKNSAADETPPPSPRQHAMDDVAAAADDDDWLFSSPAANDSDADSLRPDNEEAGDCMDCSDDEVMMGTATPSADKEAPHHNDSTIAHLHTPCGRRTLTLDAATLAGLYDRQCGLEAGKAAAAAAGAAAADDDTMQEAHGGSTAPLLSIPLAELKDRRLAAIHAAAAALNLRRYGAHTEQKGRRAFLQRWARPAFSHAYADHQRLLSSAWNLSFHPFDPAAHAVPAISDHPAFAPLVEQQLAPAALLWDGSYFLAPPSAPVSAARQQLRKAITDSHNAAAGPTLAVCIVAVEDAPEYLRKALADDHVWLAGVCDPSAEQTAAFDAFAALRSDDSTVPARKAAEMILIVANAAGRAAFLPSTAAGHHEGDPTQLLAFQEARRQHSELHLTSPSLLTAVKLHLAQQPARITLCPETFSPPPPPAEPPLAAAAGAPAFHPCPAAAPLPCLSDVLWTKPPPTLDNWLTNQVVTTAAATPQLLYNLTDSSSANDPLLIFADGSCVSDAPLSLEDGKTTTVTRAGAAASRAPALAGREQLNSLLHQYSGVQASAPAEFVAVLLAVRLAAEDDSGASRVVIFSDFSPALHKTVNYCTRPHMYRKQYSKELWILEPIRQAVASQPNKEFSFVKVKAHSGILPHDIADGLAQRAARAEDDPRITVLSDVAQSQQGAGGIFWSLQGRSLPRPPQPQEDDWDYSADDMPALAGPSTAARGGNNTTFADNDEVTTRTALRRRLREKLLLSRDRHIRGYWDPYGSHSSPDFLSDVKQAGPWDYHRGISNCFWSHLHKWEHARPFTRGRFGDCMTMQRRNQWYPRRFPDRWCPHCAAKNPPEFVPDSIGHWLGAVRCGLGITGGLMQTLVDDRHNTGVEILCTALTRIKHNTALFSLACFSDLEGHRAEKSSSSTLPSSLTELLPHELRRRKPDSVLIRRKIVPAPTASPPPPPPKKKKQPAEKKRKRVNAKPSSAPAPRSYDCRCLLIDVKFAIEGSEETVHGANMDHYEAVSLALNSQNTDDMLVETLTIVVGSRGTITHHTLEELDRAAALITEGQPPHQQAAAKSIMRQCAKDLALLAAHRAGSIIACREAADRALFDTPAPQPTQQVPGGTTPGGGGGGWRGNTGGDPRSSGGSGGGGRHQHPPFPPPSPFAQGPTVAPVGGLSQAPIATTGTPLPPRAGDLRLKAPKRKRGSAQTSGPKQTKKKKKKKRRRSSDGAGGSSRPAGIG